MDSKRIGKRIQAARIAVGMTQVQLAEKTGLTPKYISNIECGAKLPKFETFITLANTLHIDANSLLVDVLDRTAEITASTLSDKLASLSEDEQRKLLQIFEIML